MPDDEIAAMTSIAETLEPLTQEQRERVLDWAVARFSDGPTASSRLERRPGDEGNDGADPKPAEFEDFADLYDRVDPAFNGDRLLTAGYWFQVVEGADSFTARQVNDKLKDLGHGVGSIAKVFGSLQDRKPAQVRQLSKSGRSQQARKTYKLTAAGVAEIEGRL